MEKDGWEGAPEVVIGLLDAPPDLDSPEGRHFDEALRHVLSAAPVPSPKPLDPGATGA